MEDGKEQFGRVSRPLRVGDDGCWVHRLPVAWVGGYPMPQEEWVSTEKLGISVEPSASSSVAPDVEYEQAVEFLKALARKMPERWQTGFSSCYLVLWI